MRETNCVKRRVKPEKPSPIDGLRRATIVTPTEIETEGETTEDETNAIVIIIGDRTREEKMEGETRETDTEEKTRDGKSREGRK